MFQLDLNISLNMNPPKTGLFSQQKINCLDFLSESSPSNKLLNTPTDGSDIYSLPMADSSQLNFTVHPIYLIMYN